MAFRLLLIIFSITIASVTSSNPPFDVALETICRNQEDYGFCMTVFGQTPLPPPRQNIHGINVLTINQALNNATRTSIFIQDLLADSVDPAVKDCLTVCTNAYDIVRKAFKDAMTQFASGDYEVMLKGEESTPRAVASCITIIDTTPCKAVPLYRRNIDMRILITMAVVSGRVLIS